MCNIICILTAKARTLQPKSEVQFYPEHQPERQDLMKDKRCSLTVAAKEFKADRQPANSFRIRASRALDQHWSPNFPPLPVAQRSAGSILGMKPSLDPRIKPQTPSSPTNLFRLSIVPGLIFRLSWLAFKLKGSVTSCVDPGERRQHQNDHAFHFGLQTVRGDRHRAMRAQASASVQGQRRGQR